MIMIATEGTMWELLAPFCWECREKLHQYLGKSWQEPIDVSVFA